jgi:hypothetical protein
MERTMIKTRSGQIVGDRLAYTIPQFCEASGIGRTLAYNEISSGRLHVVKVGSRTLIPAPEAQAWLLRLSGAPDAEAE